MFPALFLDRDGTINEDYGYVHDVKDLKICPDILKIIKHYSDLGYLTIVVTNQSGINRGYFKEDDYNLFNSAIENELKRYGLHIDAFYHCPHTPDENCNCRKPKTGLIDAALKDFDIDLKNSFLIGDRDDTDGALARALNIRYEILKR